MGEDANRSFELIDHDTVVIPPAVDGRCGGEADSLASTHPSGEGAGFVGELTDQADSTSEYRWSCLGRDGGSDATCVATKTNGECGPADSSVVASMPAGAQACSSGSRTSASESTSYYNWSCSTGNGPSSQCRAIKDTAP